MAAPNPSKPRHLDPAVLQQIESLGLLPREMIQGTRVGMHASPMRGFSTEFAHHRQYVQGDPAKHVDWRLYGRTNRYYTKLFEAETNFDANLLLDASASMRFASGEQSKLDYAKQMAACLAYLIVSQRDSAGLGVFDDQIRSFIAPSSTIRVVSDIDTELGRITDPKPKTSISTILHQFASRMKRRGFVMLFSDLFDDEQETLRGLDHLRFRGHNVIVFHILDAHELQFPMKGAVRFEGLEQEEPITASPQQVRDAYMEELDKFVNTLRSGCERNHSDYVLVDTSRPVGETLANYLRQRVASKAGTTNQ
jgi:uncharacterized protein (DUF58 family)